MLTQSQLAHRRITDPLHPAGTLAQHAVVIGGSISGLMAARVLSDHFSQVTVVDRDWLSGTPEFRRGVPQARHAHTLLPQGQMILEQYFPGLVDELLASGAIAIDAVRDIAFFQDGAWHAPRERDAKVSIACSRPLLETVVYRRVAGRANVHVAPGYETIGLHADERRKRVAGVSLRRRQSTAIETVLAADLVVDASGRQSRAPQWLYSLGYTPPEEWAINAFAGYTTRIYQRPADFAGGWKTLYVRPTPSTGPRGGIILPMEDNRWHVTLIGVAGDYPPTNETEFLEFARSLPVPQLYEAIKEAEPLTKPSGFRRTENRVRCYDKLPRYLEGFLVCGDAVYALNPIYAQGMTAAAIGSVVLDGSLQEQRHRQASAGDLTGLAEAYHQQLSEALADLWHKATRKDWGWPITDITDSVYQPEPPAPLPSGAARSSYARTLAA